MSNEHGEGSVQTDPLEIQYQRTDGQAEAGMQELANERRAFVAANNLDGREYMNDVRAVRTGAEQIAADAAAGQQPVPAEASARPAVEAARASVAAAAPEAPSPAPVPSPEAPAAPVTATQQPEQSQPAPQRGNWLVHHVKGFFHDVRGLKYKGSHAAPKSQDRDPRQN